MSITNLNTRQRASLQTLQDTFGLTGADLDRCLFFSSEQDEPWLPPDLLQAIARQVGSFTYVGVNYDQFIAPLNQCVWTARVIDDRSRTFERSGVATICERLPDGAEIDTHVLASGRALGAALTAAGFNPFRTGAVASVAGRAEEPNPTPISDGARAIFDAAQSAELRGKDLRQIHKLAADAGLIVGKDQRGYRAWLEEKYGVRTAALMSATERASVINALTNASLGEHLVDVSSDLMSDALIA